MNLHTLARKIWKRLGDKIYNLSDAAVKANASRLNVPVGVFLDALDLATTLVSSKDNNRMKSKKTKKKNINLPSHHLDLIKVNESLKSIAKNLSEQKIDSFWGLSSSPNKYSKETEKEVLGLIPRIRKEVVRKYKIDKKPNKYDLFPGMRFNSDKDVLRAIKTKLKEEQFKRDPKKYIQMALIGAAEADYYYEFEKEF